MNTLSAILPYIQIALSVLLVVGVLLQQSSSGLGGAFGEANNMSGFHTKRGFEKTLFNGTIIIGILFAVSAFVALLI
ncbi:MAG: preprotein translocase subunit SecG [Candidatus Taylorbacteria bacterium]